MNSFATRCSDATDGDANRAERCPILKYTTNSFAASPGPIPRKISSPSARDAMLGFTMAQLTEDLPLFLPQKTRSKRLLVSASYGSDSSHTKSLPEPFQTCS